MVNPDSAGLGVVPGVTKPFLMGLEGVLGGFVGVLVGFAGVLGGFAGVLGVFGLDLVTIMVGCCLLRISFLGS